MRKHWAAAALAGVLPCAVAAQTAETPDATMVLPDVVVVGTTPLSGAGADRAKVPANTEVLRHEDLTRSGPPSALRALDERVGGVTLADAQGNRFQPNLVYRGFEASPLVGNAQGLAVYVNGARFNQPFGDSVNFDLIPDEAIDRIELQGSNPAFGLNALGGSISVRLKDGFTYHGGQLELQTGSFGRGGASLEYGKQSGNVAAYVAGTILHEDGWRRRNGSDIRRVFGDLGWRGDRAEVHLGIIAADNRLDGPGTVPVELLAIDRRASFTDPNRITNKYLRVSLSGTYDISDSVSLQGVAYYTNLSQRVRNGNTANAQPCGDGSGNLCRNSEDVLTGLGGNPIPDTLNGGPYSQLDRQGLDTNGYGASLQASWTSEVLGRSNRLVAGASFDGGVSRFAATTAVGGLSEQRAFLEPSTIISQADASIAPVRLSATNAYYGLYLQDVLDVTSRLTVTASGRLNVADISLRDQLGTSLNGNHSFTRLNPALGATYKITPNLSAYAGYAEANRAPIPAELSCASPSSPCTLTNFFVADPSLKQVVSHTFEAGLRGGFTPATGADLRWKLGVFRTDSDDDIRFVASDIPGRNFFRNVGTTRRQGVEADASLRAGRLSTFLAYAYTDATFQSPLTIDGNLNPRADADGLLRVRPGDRLPGVPQHRLKFGASYEVTDAWTVGFTGLASSGQYLFGDENNRNPKTQTYAVLNLNTAYQLTESIQLFGLVQNATDARYETFGAFSPTAAVPIVGAPGAANPRSLSPAPPIAGYGGMRVRF